MYEDFTFVDGIGSVEKGECCLLSAAYMVVHPDKDEIDDDPDGVCSVIRSVGTYINDHVFDNPEDRKQWALPRVSKIIGTANLEGRNIQILADATNHPYETIKAFILDEFYIPESVLSTVPDIRALFEELIRA
jgi:hypothetical protein